MGGPGAIDETHDPALRSWVEGADGHPDFPIQNLPLGVFAPEGEAARPGVAIGDAILDLQATAALLPAAVQPLGAGGDDLSLGSLRPGACDVESTSCTGLK